jgi:hypothetical protein
VTLKRACRPAASTFTSMGLPAPYLQALEMRLVITWATRKGSQLPTTPSSACNCKVQPARLISEAS